MEKMVSLLAQLPDPFWRLDHSEKVGVRVQERPVLAEMAEGTRAPGAETVVSIVSRFVFQWGTRYPSTVSFELHAEHGGTTVRLTESGYPNSSEGRDAMLECASGWGEALTLLKFYIEHGVIYTPPKK